MPKAVEYERWGGPEVLEVVEVPEVHPSEERVRIAVRAAALNPFDFKMRSGLVPLDDPKFPRGIASDFAGVVDEVGEGAVYFDGTPIQVGDEVLGWGEKTARQQLVVPAKNIVRKPAELSWEVAASLSTPVQTAHAAIETIGVHEGDVVLQGAASGSVGFVASQIAIARGAQVIGTAGLGNFDLLESVGIIPTTYGPGLADRVRALAPAPVTAVEDNFGREALDAGVELGVDPARMVTIVDKAAAVELGMPEFSYNRKAEVLQKYTDLAAAGALVLPIEAVFPLDEVRAAFMLLEGRHLSGKVVLSL
jgi:NADPH:quinone reductase-like Zn-dependent oxidoreductase